MRKLFNSTLACICFLFSIYSSQAQLDFSLSYEETSCGLLQFDLDLNGALIQLQSVSFGDGTSQLLANNENFEHIYSPYPEDYEVCFNYYSIGTTELSETCIGISVAGCPEEYCWAEIWGSEVECGVVQVNMWNEFQFFDNEEVFWDFGDGTTEYGFSWTEHEYDEPGVYVICGEMWNEFCQNGSFNCFTIEVEGCPNECEEPLVYQETSCGEWSFAVGENWSVEFAIWDFGDGVIEETPFNEVVTATHQYTESGTYEVCVNYYDLSCNGMTEECFTIDVILCDEPCLQDIYAAELECGLWEFEIGSSNTVTQVSWFLPDGIGDSFSNYVQYEFLTSGGYDVCVSYFDLECNQYLTQCIYVVVDVCVQNCEAQLVYWEEECGEYYFEIVGLEDISGIEWDFGDGAFDYSEEPFIYHSFEENGDFFVCPWFWSETCLEEVGDCCVDVVVDCHEDESCGEITYEFLDCMQAEFTFEGESNGLYNQWQVYFNGELIQDHEAQGPTNIIFQQSGLYTIAVSDAFNCEGNIVPLGIEVWVEPCPICPEVYIEYLECLDGGFYYIGEIEGSAYCWELWSNGTMLSTYYDESFTQMTFPGPGEYQVGVTNALNCNGQSEDYFITVTVEGCETECPEVYTEYLECLDGGFYYEGEIDGSSYCWEVWQNGSMITTYYDEVFTTVSFSSPGVYQVGVTNAIGCLGESTSYFIDVIVEDCGGNSCGCEQNNNLLSNGDFEADEQVNSGLEFDCSCQFNSVCVGSEPRDKCLNTYWLDDFYDHTYGTPNGNFLIIDGGNGNVWNDQVSVVAGETYNFSMWIARQISNSTGNNSSQVLYTQVNGFVHQEFHTADSSPEGWTEYCFEYTALETEVITIGLYQEDGEGYNDWGLDDIYFGTCGSETTCEFESYVSQFECGEVEFLFSEFTSEGYVDFGDGTPSEYIGNYTVHTYEAEGWYEVCVEYFNIECQEWLADCFEVFVEGCEEECENYIHAEVVECNQVMISIPEGVQVAWLDLGDGNFMTIEDSTLLYEYDQPGWYTICSEYYNEECGDGYYGCADVYVEGCEEDECTQLVLGFEGDFGDVGNYTELLECVIDDEFGTVWEGIIPISTLLEDFELELCLPDGCYGFSITNSDPLLLASLGIALQSVESDEVDVNIELDIFSGTLEANFGIGTDCTVGIEEASVDFAIYPVPTADVVNVVFESSGWDYAIMDMTGRIIDKNVNSEIHNRIDATLWSDGLYLIQATKGNSTLTGKVEVKN